MLWRHPEHVMVLLNQGSVRGSVQVISPRTAAAGGTRFGEDDHRVFVPPERCTVLLALRAHRITGTFPENRKNYLMRVQ